MRRSAWWAVLVIGGMLFGSHPAQAESRDQINREGTIFRSASGRAQAIYGRQDFDVFLDDAYLYRASTPHPQLPFGDLWLSDDGRVAVWMLPVRFLGHSSPQDNVPALHFYVNGELLATYSLPELLVRSSLISTTRTHTQWIVEQKSREWTPAPPPIRFAPDGSSLSFETTSFRRYTFDPRTGQMIYSGDNPLWSQADLIVYGPCRPKAFPWNQGSPLVQMGDVQVVKGQLAERSGLIFHDPTGQYRNGRHLVLLKREKGEWKALAWPERVEIEYNAIPK